MVVGSREQNNTNLNSSELLEYWTYWRDLKRNRKKTDTKIDCKNAFNKIPFEQKNIWVNDYIFRYI